MIRHGVAAGRDVSTGDPLQRAAQRKTRQIRCNWIMISFFIFLFLLSFRGGTFFLLSYRFGSGVTLGC